MQATKVGVGVIGGLGALCFYFINKWIFVKDKEVKENNDETERKENDEVTPREDTTEKGDFSDTGKGESVK